MTAAALSSTPVLPSEGESKLARESGTKVVQVGEGSDELFCGYSDYAGYLDFYNRVWRRLSGLPVSIRRATAALGQGFSRTGIGGLLPKGGKMLPDLFRPAVRAI